MFLLEEVREKDNDQRWNPTFQMLALDTRHLTEDKTLKAAKAPQNRQLNRYRDVLPYDDTRVLLKTGNSDYINGNYVEVPVVGRKYILAQGPLQNTCPDFWRMIWENESCGIVMLCRIVEKQMIKCHPYWPMGEDEVLDFGSFHVKNIQSVMESDYIIRDLLLTYVLNTKTQSSKMVYTPNLVWDTDNSLLCDTGESRTIKQFHFMTWPDFGVPENAASFLAFLDILRTNNIFGSDKPPVIHCSAGIGRSGTIILVDAALKLCEDNKSPDSLDIRNMLLNMRKYRCGLVQTAQQYRFAYVAILTGLYKRFPHIFQDAIEQEEEEVDEEEDGEEADDEEDDEETDEEIEPPALPEKSTKSIVPPQKPPRATLSHAAAEKDAKKFKQLNELSEGSDDDEEEIIDLSGPELDDDVEKENNDDDDDVSDEEIEELDESESEEEYTALVKENEESVEGESRLDGVKKAGIENIPQERDENIPQKQDENQEEIIGTKARENELRHRQRQEKKEATKDLINNIKKKMKDSEKRSPFENKAFWYVGVAIVVTSCVAIVYKWLS